MKEGEPDQLAGAASGALLWPSPGDIELVTAGEQEENGEDWEGGEVGGREGGGEGAGGAGGGEGRCFK